jgi:hypothetical protein
MNDIEPELVIKIAMITWGLGLAVGIWAGYALRGPKVDRLKGELAALRETLAKGREALGE